MIPLREELGSDGLPWVMHRCHRVCQPFQLRGVGAGWNLIGFEVPGRFPHKTVKVSDSANVIEELRREGFRLGEAANEIIGIIKDLRTDWMVREMMSRHR